MSALQHSKRGLIRALPCILALSALQYPPETQAVDLPKSLNELQHSPSPHEFAVLAKHVYRNDIKKGDSVVVERKDSDDIELPDWQVLEKLEESSAPFDRFKSWFGNQGYRGAIYYNEKRNLLVLAHRGSDLSHENLNLSALYTDLFSILGGGVDGQMLRMRTILGKLTKHWKRIKDDKGRAPTLSSTGHSLGGWLAQITAFLLKEDPDFSKNLDNDHCKVVTFDSPGARPMFKHLMKGRSDSKGINQLDLDITNYVSSPNLVNSCNTHLCSRYRVIFKEFSEKRSEYLFQSHSMDNFLDAFDSNSGKAKKIVKVLSWPDLQAKGWLLSWFLGWLPYWLQYLLGIDSEYKGFFEFAKKTNRYLDPTEGKRYSYEKGFILKYRYHYQVIPFDQHSLPMRHVPVEVQNFFKWVTIGNPKAVGWIKADPGLDGKLNWDVEDRRITHTEQDVRLVIDKLVGIVQANPLLAKKPKISDSSYFKKTTNSRESRLGKTPPSLPYFVGRKKAIKELTQKLGIKDSQVIVPVVGSGGMGKTQLVRHFIDKQAERQRRTGSPYKRIVWIPAETAESIRQAYIGFAEALNVSKEGKEANQIAKDVREALQKEYSLYVFDSARNYQTMEHYLPSQGHILVTSQDKTSWPRSPIELKPFTDEEAIELAKQSAQLFGFSYTPAEEKKLRELVLSEHMPRHPLVFAHLLATIFDYKYTAQEFGAVLEQAEEFLKLLQGKARARAGYDKRDVNVLEAVLGKSLTLLEQNKHGKEAILLLQNLAYLSPQGVPFDFLQSWGIEDSKLREALVALEGQSLISWKGGDKQYVYMHESMQRFVRMLKPLDSLDQLVGKIWSYVGNYDKAYDHLDRWTALVPHGTKLLGLLEKMGSSSELLATQESLANYLREAADLIGDPRDQFKWAEKHRKITEARYPGKDHPDVASSYNNLGLAHSDKGEYDKAIEFYQKALKIQRKKLGADHPDVASSYNNLGLAYRNKGQNDKAIEFHQKALKIRKKERGEEHPSVASSYNNLGNAYYSQGQYDKAIEFYQKALKIQRKKLGDDHPSVASSYNNLGTAYSDKGQYDKAIEFYQKSLKIRLKKLGDDHPDVANSYIGLGTAYSDKGQYDKAIEFYQKALKIQRKKLGVDHLHVATSYSNLGNAYYSQGQYDKAIEFHQKSLKIKRKKLGADHPSVASSYNNLGNAYSDKGQYDKAIEFYQKSLKIKRKKLGDDHPSVADSYHNLGLVYRSKGQYDKAIEFHQKSLKIKRKKLGADHPSVASSYHNLGTAYYSKGQYEKAIAYYEQCLAIREVRFGKNHPWTGAVRELLEEAQQKKKGWFW